MLDYYLLYCRTFHSAHIDTQMGNRHFCMCTHADVVAAEAISRITHGNHDASAVRAEAHSAITQAENNDNMGCPADRAKAVAKMKTVARKLREAAHRLSWQPEEADKMKAEKMKTVACELQEAAHRLSKQSEEVVVVEKVNHPGSRLLAIIAFALFAAAAHYFMQ